MVFSAGGTRRQAPRATPSRLLFDLRASANCHRRTKAADRTPDGQHEVVPVGMEGGRPLLNSVGVEKSKPGIVKVVPLGLG
jgi:hypothetical protein